MGNAILSGRVKISIRSVSHDGVRARYQQTDGDIEYQNMECSSLGQPSLDILLKPLSSALIQFLAYMTRRQGLHVLKHHPSEHPEARKPFPLVIEP